MSAETRQALRSFIRRPAFSAVIVLTVALAVAATTLVFAVVNGVLLAPLPYENPDRLVTVWEHFQGPEQDDPRNVVSPANFLTWRDELRSFDGMAAFFERSTTLLGEGEPERVGVMVASAAYFEIMGAQPLVGRFYDEAEDAPGGPDVVVLAEGYWRRRFGADTSVVGRTLTISGRPRTVVGVFATPLRLRAHELCWRRRNTRRLVAAAIGGGGRPLSAGRGPARAGYDSRGRAAGGIRARASRRRASASSHWPR